MKAKFINKIFFNNVLQTLTTPLGALSLCVFCFIVYIYCEAIIRGPVGIDLVMRITETKYFLKGVNPFDAFVERVLIDASLGKPAAYTPISYLLMSPFSLIQNKEIILVIYSIADILCLYYGLYLLRKILKVRYTFVDPFLVLIVSISMIRLDHLVYLNYGIISIFGLILALYGGQYKKNYAAIIVGSILVSLKPSLLLPLFVSLILTKNIKIIIIVLLTNITALAIASAVVNESGINLILQLKEAQSIFTAHGFYRWEGFFLFLRDRIGTHATAVGLIATTICMFICRRSMLKSTAININIIIIMSLAFFYNQEHAWTMAYSILAYCLYSIHKARQLIYPTLILIVYMLMPSMYVNIEAQGFIHYMDYHNFVRFGLLILVGVWILNVQNKSSLATD